MSSEREQIAREDAETKALLHEIADELALNEDDASKRSRLAREVLDEYSRGVNADPDKILFLIEQELLDEPGQYPSLLDIHNGRVEDIAIKVRDHMIEAELNKDPITHKQALGRLEGLAARAKYRVWIPDDHNVQVGYGGKK